MSADTLYRLLRLRSEVFVVEQRCVFLDLDGLDAGCLHVLGEAPDGEGGVRLLASTRLVPAGRGFAEASIGRVATAPSVRGSGLGHALMATSIRMLHALWACNPSASVRRPISKLSTTGTVSSRTTSRTSRMASRTSR